MTGPDPTTDAWVSGASAAVLTGMMDRAWEPGVWVRRAAQVVAHATHWSPELVARLLDAPALVTTNGPRYGAHLEGLARAVRGESASAEELLRWVERAVEHADHLRSDLPRASLWRALRTLLRAGHIAPGRGVPVHASDVVPGDADYREALSYLWHHPDTPIGHLRAKLSASDQPSDPSAYLDALCAADALYWRTGEGVEHLAAEAPMLLLDALDDMAPERRATVPVSVIEPLLASPVASVRTRTLLCLPALRPHDAAESPPARRTGP